MLADLTCRNCGKDWRGRKPKTPYAYCSRTCANYYRKKCRATFKCTGCGIMITKIPSQVAKTKHKHFCSNTCYMAFIKANGIRSVVDHRITMTCHHCHITFKENPHRKHRGKLHFCSNECKYAHYSGPNKPNYVDGQRRKYGTGWSKARRKALERDNYKCRKCGKKRGLHVHHILPVHTFKIPGEAHYITNLVTLCTKHHGQAERGIIFTQLGIPL